MRPSAPRSTRYGPEVVERAYHLWSSTWPRNASRTRRLLMAEAGAGEPVPTDRLIRYWSHRYCWQARKTCRFGDIRGRTHHELMALTLAVYQGELDAMQRVFDSVSDPTSAANVDHSLRVAPPRSGM